jgi:hypothetical protein
MVNKRSMGGMVAAFSIFLAFPALASAHILAVSAGPSHCVSPLNGQYTATVTVTETYFGGTTENIPVGQNVYELASSTDRSNTGLNQNYFTQGSVGTQTGPANLGQPTSFTSPASGRAATQQFTVTTSVPETYVLANSYMWTPSKATITAPASGCTPPPSCPSGDTLVGGVCVPPTSCPSGETLVRGVCVPPTSCPSGETLAGGQCVPPTSCPSGETLSGGQCVPPTTCPAGENMAASGCVTASSLPAPTVYPAVCRASSRGYKVRAGQADTIIVAVDRQGQAVAGATVHVTLPGGKKLTKTTGKNGKARFTVEPTRGGTILVRSPSCARMVKVKVYAAKAATALRAPSFTG